MTPTTMTDNDITPAEMSPADMGPVPEGAAPREADLVATALIDHDHPAVQAFVREHARGETAREQLLSLYLAVRDGFRYNPYQVDLSPEGMRASRVIENGFGWCVPKSALMVAVSRAIGVPARVGYADVRNHLSTERLRQTMNTDLFIWHGFAEIFLDGQWVKATPVFNIELCQKFGLHALEWDGRHDSLYHAFDQAGNRHMEYVNQRGSFHDVPLAAITRDFARVYKGWDALANVSVDFEADVAQETGAPGRA